MPAISEGLGAPSASHMAAAVAPTAPLLRSNTVPQLRELAQNLARDRDARRAELQLMVGSKYHDFIESADEISKMHSAARDVGESLLRVSSQSKFVIERTSFLLPAVPAAGSPHQSSSAGVTTNRHDPIGAGAGSASHGAAVGGGGSPVSAKPHLTGCMLTAFWSSITACDVCDASKALVISFAIHASGVQGSSSNLQLPVYPAPAASLQSLWNTVVEDAALLLMHEREGVPGTVGDGRTSQSCLSSKDVANVLVALRYLLVHPRVAPNSLGMSPMLPFAEHIIRIGAHSDLSGWQSSLELYLASVSNTVQSLIGLDSSSARVHPGEVIHVDAIIAAIDAIKCAILNVYIIFFHRDIDTSSLIHNRYLDFVSSVETSLREVAIHSWSNLDIICPKDNVLLREVWSSWFFGSDDGSTSTNSVLSLGSKGMAGIISNACVECLRRTKQSGEVSLIQTKVKKSCLSSPGSAVGGSEADGGVLLWSAACKTLLQKHRSFRSVDDDEVSIKHSELLWTRVLRIPFLHQIESALAESAGKSLLRIQKRIQLSLKNGLDVEIVPGRPLVSPSNVSQDLGSDVKEIRGFSYSNQTHGLSSSDIFGIARTLASHLDAEIRSLCAGVGVNPASGSRTPQDALQAEDGHDDSIHSLALLVQANCTQLIGQVLALVRSVVHRLQSALNISTQKGSLSQELEKHRLEDALLVLGRFCWLLRVGGTGIATALKFGSADAARTASAAGAREAIYYSSFSQLQSAFEIADGDGDGLLNYAEAVEAMNALGLNNDSLDDSSPKASCLWPDGEGSVSSLRGLYRPENVQFSFAEFACTCAKFCRTPNQVDSLSELIIADLNDISLTCHKSWVRSAVDNRAQILHSGLKRELGLSLTLSNLKDDSIAPNFLQMWAKFSLNDVSGDQGDESSQLYLPNGLSAPVHTLLHSLFGKVSAKVCSVDTMQAVVGPSPDNNSLSLFERTRQDITLEAFRVLITLYLQLAKQSNNLGNLKLLAEFGSSSENDGLVKLQLLFDLLVLKELTSAVDYQKRLMTVQEIERIISLVSDDVDPVSVQLALPILRERTKEAVSVELLLFGSAHEGSSDKRKAIEDNNQHSTRGSRIFSAIARNHQYRLGLLPLPAIGTGGSSAALGGQAKNRVLPPDALSTAAASKHAADVPGPGGLRGPSGKASGAPAQQSAVLAGVQRGIAAVWS